MRRLAVLPIKEALAMAEKRHMMTSTWDTLVKTLYNDPPEGEFLPIHKAFYEIIGEYIENPQPVVHLDEAISQFLKDREVSGTQNSAMKDYRSILAEFSKTTGLGSTDVKMISRPDVRKYTEMLQKNTEYTIKTKQNKKTMTNTFLRWLVAQGLANTNAELDKAFDTVKFNERNCKKTKKNKSFTDSAAAAICDRLREEERDGAYPWRWWIFLLCLFSGARPGEICQMNTKDIIQKIDNEPVVPSMVIRADEMKSIKNSTSERVVPIHPHVLKEGFLEYVRLREKAHEEKLFSLGKRHPQNGFTQNATKFFSPLFRGMGLPYTLSDCRHTVETKFHHMEMTDHERRIAARLTGRAVTVSGIRQSVTAVQWRHYVTEDFTPDAMLPVLARLHYEGIDA